MLVATKHLVAGALIFCTVGVSIAACSENQSNVADSIGTNSAAVKDAVIIRDDADADLSQEEAAFAAIINRQYREIPDFYAPELPIHVESIVLRLDEILAQLAIREDTEVEIPLLAERTPKTYLAKLMPLDNVRHDVAEAFSQRHEVNSINCAIYPALAIPQLDASGQQAPDASVQVECAWYWHPSPFGVIPLEYLNVVRISSKPTAEQFVWRDTAKIDVELDYSDSIVLRACRELMWWRNGDHFGVSLASAPSAILLLFEHVKFSLGDVIFTVKSNEKTRLGLTAIRLLDHTLFTLPK